LSLSILPIFPVQPACFLFVSSHPAYSSCPASLLSVCLFPSCLFFLSSLLSVSPSVCLFPSCLFFLSSQPALCLSLPPASFLRAYPAFLTYTSICRKTVTEFIGKSRSGKAVVRVPI
jgi:hypothetical protein